MKKINITSEGMCAIAFTIIEWICVLIAAAFALQQVYEPYDGIGAILWLICAGLTEIAKYKVTHTYYGERLMKDKED